MHAARKPAPTWRIAGVLLRALGVIDFVCSHLPPTAYPLGNWDRAFELLTLGAVVLGPAAILKELASIPSDAGFQRTAGGAGNG